MSDDQRQIEDLVEAALAGCRAREQAESRERFLREVLTEELRARIYVSWCEHNAIIKNLGLWQRWPKCAWMYVQIRCCAWLLVHCLRYRPILSDGLLSKITRYTDHMPSWI